MPLQNRVNPWGLIVAHPARYAPSTAIFGNRGVLHDDQRKLVRQCHGRMWLACRLHVNRIRKTQRDDNRAFNGRKRSLMTPRRYTELFFLDEPTAMAAGHRPCACCRRSDHQQFMRAWQSAHPRSIPWTAPAVDAVLHAERLANGGGKLRFSASLAELADGTMVSLEPTQTDAWLLWRGELHEWSHLGYGSRRSAASFDGQLVEVLTPRSLNAVLLAGFEPGLPHESAHTRRTQPATPVIDENVAGDHVDDQSADGQRELKQREFKESGL